MGDASAESEDKAFENGRGAAELLCGGVFCHAGGSELGRGAVLGVSKKGDGRFGS